MRPTVPYPLYFSNAQSESPGYVIQLSCRPVPRPCVQGTSACGPGVPGGVRGAVSSVLRKALMLPKQSARSLLILLIALGIVSLAGLQPRVSAADAPPIAWTPLAKGIDYALIAAVPDRPSVFVA